MTPLRHRDGEFVTALPPFFAAKAAHLAGHIYAPDPITPICRVADYLPQGDETQTPVFALALRDPFDHLHFRPAPSTPDSLRAHDDLYFHIIGLKQHKLILEILYLELPALSSKTFELRRCHGDRYKINP
jgi:hypothetical protein